MSKELCGKRPWCARPNKHEGLCSITPDDLTSAHCHSPAAQPQAEGRGEEPVREYVHLPTNRQGNWRNLNPDLLPTIPLLDPAKSLADNYEILWKRYASESAVLQNIKDLGRTTMATEVGRETI